MPNAHSYEPDWPAEPALFKSQPQIVQWLESLPAGAYTCDTEGLITYFNRRAAEIWGRSPLLNDSRDRYCGSFKLFTPQGVPLRHEECWMALALHLQREYNGQEIVIERPDGQRMTALAHANPIYGDSGEMLGAVNLLVDITERRSMEEALEQSRVRLKHLNQSLEQKVAERTGELLDNQKKLRLLASRLSATEQRERRRVAMELHDNLAQILAICKMKLAASRRKIDGMEGDEDVDSLTAALNDALKYTRSLISDLSPPLELGENNLLEAIHWVANKMGKHGLEVVIEDDGEQRHLDTDTFTTVFESVRELLFNIIRHSGSESARIRLRDSEGRIEIEVVDEGCGFDPELEASRDGSGQGLGLFSIQERLAAVGGRFELHSRIGDGTRALLSVRGYDGREVRERVDGHSIGGPARENGGTPRSPKEIRVLLADDHKIMRDGLRKIIDAEEDMHVVAEAANGQEAVMRTLELRPDIVVMDVGMPLMNGIEATRRISSELPGVRIIALSLSETPDSVEAMLEAGASFYLFKTEAFESLCTAIRKHGRKKA